MSGGTHLRVRGTDDGTPQHGVSLLRASQSRFDQSREGETIESTRNSIPPVKHTDQLVADRMRPSIGPKAFLPPQAQGLLSSSYFGTAFSKRPSSAALAAARTEILVACE
jgi:hypothetical protein